MSINKTGKLFICGHTGMLGSAVLRKFRAEGFSNLILRRHTELDLTDDLAVKRFFEAERPDYVILVAAKVGGIGANIKDKAHFLYENLRIQNNVIYSSWKYGVQKLCFLGSSCIYPCHAPQPLKEEYLLNGIPEPTNEGYALAKITGLKLCEYLHVEKGFNAISLMPCNLYGTGDHFEENRSHVVAALIRRFSEASERGDKEITLWGTGTPYRELMHVDDAADAVHFFMENYDGVDFINIGPGRDITIAGLAEKIARITGFKGKICWDTSKPDGMARKLLDVSRATRLGWCSRISLDEGLARTYQEYLLWRKHQTV